MRIAITTRYKSNHNGAGRYHARAKGYTATASVQIDHALSDEQNCLRAADKLATKIGAEVVGRGKATDTGYVFRAYAGTYEQREIDLMDAHAEGYALKIETRGDGPASATRWLSVTAEQVQAIRALLGDA